VEDEKNPTYFVFGGGEGENVPHTLYLEVEEGKNVPHTLYLEVEEEKMSHILCI
jgi:hypothetical protein